MKFTRYIRDKINFILAFIVYLFLIVVYLKTMKVNSNAIWVVSWISILFFVVGFFLNFSKKNAYFKQVNQIMDELEEKYLISEILKKPRREEDLAHFQVLKKATKSMIENVTQTRNAQKSYKEYIESWVHEIKLPITSSKLLCENHQSEVTEKIEEELEIINNYVEQALFYARLDQVSNDFMIREVKLYEVVQNVLARNKKIMIQNKMKVEMENCQITAYTDEKWLEFIIHQIMLNSIQYKKLENPEIYVEIKKHKENVAISIQDNGIGIKSSEIDRVFEKGFTGTNGRNQKKSTGIGLYLCQKLCQELGMEIEAESVENEFTKIILIIPKNSVEK